MLFVIMPLLLMIVCAMIEGQSGDPTFSSMEYRKYMDHNNTQEDMNIKKLASAFAIVLVTKAHFSAAIASKVG